MPDLLVVEEEQAARIQALCDAVFVERARQLKKFGVQDNPSFNADGALGDEGSPRYNEEEDPEAPLLNQEALKRLNDLATAAGKRTWAGVLLEEVAEALDEDDESGYREQELIQVAAVCLAWVENLQKRKGVSFGAPTRVAVITTPPNAFEQILQKLDLLQERVIKLDKPELLIADFKQYCNAAPAGEPDEETDLGDVDPGTPQRLRPIGIVHTLNDAGKLIQSPADPTHWVHCSNGSVWCKTTAYFYQQSGRSEAWGRRWKPVVAPFGVSDTVGGIEAARAVGCALFPTAANPNMLQNKTAFALLNAAREKAGV